jgi:uncharacterized protein (DUF1015 family)
VPALLPFRGLRYPVRPLVDGCPDVSPLTAPPYDVIDDPTVFEARDSNNAVRLILPRDEPRRDRYAAAAARLADWQAEGVLAVDPASRLYRYAMTFTGPDGRAGHTVGVVGALGLPADDGDVLPHERTLPKAKSDRLALLQATRANFDPIWVLSLAEGLTDLVRDEDAPLACATDDAGVAHRIGAIDDADRIARVTAAVASAPVVIADGHHRYETARAYHAEHPEDPAAAAIMALVVECATDELHVAPIHRVVRGAPQLRALLATWFDVEPFGTNDPAGVERLRAAMLERDALGLADREGLALLLPAAHLEKRLAAQPAELHDVDAARIDTAIGDAGLDVSYRADDRAVAAAVAETAADTALLLRPVTVDQIRAVAGAGLRMPQKTSYFWPKPRTGMVFRSLDQ